MIMMTKTWHTPSDSKKLMQALPRPPLPPRFLLTPFPIAPGYVKDVEHDIQ